MIKIINNKNKLNFTNKNAITLIALVIAIIILIILAGVSISLLVGENGILGKAKQASKQQKIAEITDKLELYKADLDIEDLGKLVLERYLEKLLNENVIEQSDIQETGQENSRYITVEGEYIFLIEKEESGNIKIEYLGTATEISPKITKITPTTSGYEIKVVVETIYNENGNYQYFIKESTADTYEEKENSKNSEYTFKNLKPETEYDIKVIVTNSKNLTGEKEIKAATIEGIATYYIDTDNTQTQSFAYGASVLDTSFTPIKEGYTFIGWREDNAADGNVLTEKVMSTEPITLYAVFGKELSLAYNANGGSSTPATQTDYIYYNNGNTANPTFTLAEAISRSNYKFNKWTLNSTSGTAYAAKSDITLSESATMYATWYLTYQSGSQQVNFNKNTGTQTFYISFSQPFASAPSISLSSRFVAYNEDQGGRCYWSYSGVSTTGFTLTWTNGLDSGNNYTFGNICTWTARGN